jgi:hypothetical protein
VGGRLAEPTALTGSVCESPVALSMHEHWCDLERLINCVRGDSKAFTYWTLITAWTSTNQFHRLASLSVPIQGPPLMSGH